MTDGLFSGHVIFRRKPNIDKQYKTAIVRLLKEAVFLQTQLCTLLCTLLS